MAYGAARHETEDQSVSCLPRSWATSHPEIGTRVTKENIISMFILTTRPLFFLLRSPINKNKSVVLGKRCSRHSTVVCPNPVLV